MATQRIEIVITATGAPVVRRQINEIADAADRADARMRLFHRGLALIGGGAILNSLKNYADIFTNIQNKLRFVTDGTEALAGATNALFDISMRTRSSFEATATLYSRVALATKNLAVNQQQLLDFTESLNKATILSGATSIEAANAIRQLSQGMAKGRLDGDELRSVLEQLPVVADVIAKQMKVTRGELKELGSQGKITPQIILEAFKTAKEWLDGNFTNTVPTISQAFTVLETATIRMVSEIDRSTGASAAFAKVVMTLANNMDIVAIAITAAGAALLTYFGPVIIGAIISAVARLFALLLANPYTALAAAIVGTVVAFASFNDSMDETLKKMNLQVTFVDRLIATWAGAKAYIQTAWSDFPNWLEYIIKVAVKGAIDILTTFMKTAWENLKSFFSNAKDAVVAWWNGADFQLPDLWSLELTDGARNVGDAAGEAFTNAFNRVLMSRATSMGKIDPTVNSGIVSVPEKTKGPTYDSIIDDLTQQSFLLQQEYDLRKRLTEIIGIEAKLKRALSPEEQAQVDRILQYNAQLEIQANLWDEIVQPAIVYEKTQKALSQLLKDGSINLDQYNKKWQELRFSYLETQTTMEAGIERGLLRLSKDFTDVASMLENAFVDAFSGLEDAIVKTVMTGKLSFADLARSIIEDLIRIAVRAQIIAPIVNAITGGGAAGGTANWAGIIGGAITSMMGGGMNIAAGVQASGAVTTPIPTSTITPVPLSTGTNRVPYDGFLAELHKDEAVVPARYNPAAGGGSAGGVVVIQPIIYNNASDKVSATVQTSTDEDGNTSMSVLIDSVERDLASRVDTGRSPLLTSMSRAMGTTPKPRGR